MNNMKEFSNALLGEKYYRLVHKSGLKIFIFPKERQAAWAIFATDFGSVDNVFLDENKKRVKLPDGIAHFMEHKMFDNGDGESVDDVFSRLGADPNAFTSWNRTAYIVTANAGEKFYESVGTLIDFVSNPYFTKESVEKEQGIIGQEIAMYEDDPYDRCFYGLVKGLYEKNPVRVEIVGSKESISKITPEMLYECHKRFYAPSNMVLIVCGDVDVEKTIEIINERISEDYTEATRSLPAPKERVGSYQKRVHQRMSVERPIFTIGFKDPWAPEDQVVRLRRQRLCEILSGVIFSSSNSLYTSLFKRGIITSPFSYGEEYGRGYAFSFASGECDDPELLLNEIRKYLKNLKRNGIDKADFERRKRIIYSSEIKLYDSTWDIASALLDNAFADIDIFEEAEILRSITLEEANLLLKDIFRENNMTYSVILPNEDKGEI